MTKISIIVPIYNVEHFLDKCISSIINQTYKNMEIILIDDGSTDDSYTIAKKYADKDKRIRLIHQENKGLVATRDIGISLANGEWIGFVDSDDWIAPEMFEELAKYMEKYDCDLVSSDLICVEQGKKEYVVHDNYPKALYSAREIEEKIYPTMLHDYAMNSKGLRCYLVTKLFRKDIMAEVSAEMDSRVVYGEDAMRLYRYVLKCKTIYLTREAYYYYNYAHPTSLSCHFDEKLLLSNYYLYQNLYRAFQGLPAESVLMRQLKQYVLHLEQRVLMNAYQLDRLNLMHWVFDCFHPYYDKKFIIYGAGVCGQALFREVSIREKADSLVAWLDKNPEPHIKSGHNVQPVSDINNLSYDFIFVALMKPEVAETVRNELVEMYHVDPDKIITGEIYYYDEMMNAYR